MKKKNHIKKISDYAIVGGLGSLLVVGLIGCGDSSNNNQEQQNQGQSDAFSNASQKQNAFVVIEESADGKYAIIDEFPASKTTVVLRKPDGTERILTQEEIDKLVKEEEKKIDAGTSPLTNPNAEVSSGGMGLGGVLLSSIAGAMIGSWLVINYLIIKISKIKDKLNINRLKLIVNHKVHLIKLLQLQDQTAQVVKKVVFLEGIRIQIQNLVLLHLVQKVQDLGDK